MFIGEFKHNLDPKNRLILPSKFRDTIGERFIVTCGLESCLVIYTEEGWQEYAEELQRLPYHKKDIRDYIRLVLSKAHEVETDLQGRFTIPPNLREFAELKKEVVVTGVFDKIEIWDRESWKNYSNGAIGTYEEKAEMIGELE
jgi:MraZ protein